MATFEITSTGSVSPVVLDDLGIEPLSHPFIDYDLVANHGLTVAEIVASADLRSALSLNAITAKYNGQPITLTDIDTAGHIHSQGVMDALSGTSGTPSATNRFITEAEKGVSIATLDANGTVPMNQLPQGIQGGLTWKGLWDASTNTPALASGVGTNGDMYRVSVAGSTNLDGITDWQVGDHLIFIDDGTTKKWEKLDNTDAVTSVAGKVGAVTLQANDLTDVDITTGANGDLLGIVDNAGTLKIVPVTGGQGQLHTHTNKAVLDKITAAAVGSATPPGTPSVGDIWVRTTDGEVFTYTGVEWVSIATYAFSAARTGSFTRGYLRTVGRAATNNVPFICTEKMVMIGATLSRRTTVQWILQVRKNGSTANVLTITHAQTDPNKMVVSGLNQVFNQGEYIHLRADASPNQVRDAAATVYFKKVVP